jgi:tRNA A37 threonylcarbamoyltransferase TsaD
MAQIDRIVQQALQKAGLSSPAQVDAIGVTVGPGLEICLRVGMNKARDMAIQFKKPFVGVHHLEAHILMSRLPLTHTDNTQGNGYRCEGMETSEAVRNSSDTNVPVIDFPFLALLVSGGHCQLLKCIGIGNYTILGGTIDDSLGEAFDKTARLLGLPVGGGGGPAVERLARDGNATSIPFSVPLRHRRDCDFSYSGLKTNVRRYTEQLINDRGVSSIEELPYQDKADIAASFQHVAIQHVEQRLSRAMGMVEPEGISTVALVGGVAANQELRRRVDKLCQSRKQPWQLVVPPPRLCTDQGSMSAWAAIERIMVGSTDDPYTQEVYARYPFVSQEARKQ